ncbi:sigma 54-interacting transcriptional regulator [Carboxydothermus pertinax]|uniref:HTH-type transcriptional regulatory protein TyrR n=1 Tax=Carboxydothermus pertinax TaxID=870242 RepID=A0A1L8CT12_9THEO|nr:sigma 54-interacting transcriptional regulator [Carboxydothermus pertinax]GAV21984.1 hypothetical protein cpu_04940 [Carboxydothermus pertinax]
MQIKQIMTTKLIAIEPDGTLREATYLMRLNKIDALPVVDQSNKLLGLITKSHVLDAFLNNLSPDTPVKKLMITELFTFTPEEDADKTWEVPVGRVPVVDSDGKIIGIVTRTDLIRSYYKELKRLNSLLNERLENYREALKHLRESQYQQPIVYKSAAMEHVVELARRVADIDATVLILGESGSGKEVIASLIHQESRRRTENFIKINCSAIPDNLLESELFGYEQGAFSGANKNGKPGLFELANHGTIFLDEIGDLPLQLQAKLLRVLQDKEIYRLGSTTPRKLDVRIIAATNRDLSQMVKNKTFREDLYYRLNVIPIVIPPLRERPEDIPALIHYFLEVFNKKHGFKKLFAPELVDFLTEKPWPGNVRELSNTVERLVIVSTGKIVTLEDYQNLFTTVKIKENPEDLSLAKKLNTVEKSLILKALETHGSTRKAAKALGISQASFIRKARKHGIKTGF